MWPLWMPAHAAETVDETTVLSGFSVTWERRPHRIKVLGIDAERAELDAVTDIEGGSWADGQRGSDVPTADVDLLEIAGRPVTVGTVRMTLGGRNAIEGRRREAGSATTTVSVDGVDEGTVAVFLTGFRFATDTNHPDGYTVHTMSVGLGPPDVDHGTARIPVEVTFAGGAVPDRRQDLGSYGADIEIDWAAIPCRPDEVQRQTVDQAVHLWPSAVTRPADAGRRTSALAWTLPAPVAVGLSGFHIDIHDGLFDGRYARGLVVEVSPTDDPLRSTVELGFDNTGPISRAMRVDLQADVTALAIRPTDRVTTRAYHSEPSQTTPIPPRRDRVGTD